MNIVAVAGDIGATIADIRLRQPLAALCAAEGWSLQLKSLHDCSQADLLAADVMVLQRGASRRAWQLLQRMQASGGRVVYEIDDLLTDVPPDLLHADALRAGRAYIEQSLAAADAVTTTTERLAAALRPLARQIAVVPNYAFADAPRAAPRDPAAPLSLLFAASDRVAAEVIMPALAAVAALRPQRLQLVCVGPTGLPLEALGLPLQRHAPMPRGEFVAFVASLVNPVAVIPLGESAFSACKSAIKYFDFAAIGVPVLCSRVPPYADVAVDGHNAALVDNTAAAWQAALLRAIDEPAWCQTLATAAAVDVAAGFTLAQTTMAWHGLLLSLGTRSTAAPAAAWWSRLGERVRLLLRAANRSRLARRQGR